MFKRSWVVQNLVNTLGLVGLLVLLTHCTPSETAANFHDHVETIVPGNAMSGRDWRLSLDGTKLYYHSQDADKIYPSILLYLETDETLVLDRSRCVSRLNWLDGRLLACGLDRTEVANLFDTEQRHFLSRSQVKRSEVDLEALLSEAGRIYYHPLDTLLLLDSDPYVQGAKNYIIKDDTKAGFEAILADYSYITLPIYPAQDKVFSPDQHYYYSLLEDGDHYPGAPIYTLTIFSAADDQEVTSFTTAALNLKMRINLGKQGGRGTVAGSIFQSAFH